VRLRNRDEVKGIPLKAGQLEAFLPAILEIEQGPIQSSRQGNRTTYKVTVTTTLEPSQLAHRLDKLRNDPDVVAGLMEVSKHAETLYPLLASVNTAKEQESLAIRLRANRWMALSYAAIAKTEESPSSVRVPSRLRSQRAMQMAEAAIQFEPGLPEA